MPPVRSSLVAAFGAHFGRGGPVRTFFAPGRVNLMGAHLDYNGGAVMPMAIDRGTLVAARITAGGRVRLLSEREAGVFDGTVGELPQQATGNWFDYPLGVLRQVAAALPRGAGVELVFGGDLPIGAGLSSSASICVATALAIEALCGELEVPPSSSSALGWVERALVAEREFVGVQCGIMDPYAVGLGRPGHLLWLDCRDRSYEHIALDTSRYAVGVVDTRVRRELAAGEFNRRVAQCGELLALLKRDVPNALWLRDVPREVFDARLGELPEVLAARGRHVFGEFERTQASRAALERGDVHEVGRSMVATHHSLRDDYAVSIPELDTIVETAVAVEGVLGARLTGAGFGGCCVVLLERGHEDALSAAVATEFERRFGHAPGISFFSGGAGPHEVEAEG